MICNTFQELNLSNLGFGTMRLPVLADGSIDQEQVEAMTAYAKELTAQLEALPKWTEICRQREDAAANLKKEG